MGLLMLMGDSGFRGALDTLSTGLASAWSVARRTRTAYNRLDPIVRVRRDSDNTESDFAGDANGVVSASAVAAFCGVGGGFYRTIYDQSGLGRHLEQTSTSIQPIACEAGVAVTQGGRLAAKFVAADTRRLTVSSSAGLYNALHTTGGAVAYVCKVNDTAAAKCLFSNKSGTTAQGILVEYDGNEGLGVYIGRRDVAGVATLGRTVTWTPTPTDSNHKIVAINLDPDNGTAASRATGWKNGTAYVGTNADTAAPFVENAAADLTIGVRAGGSSVPFDGTFQELCIWSDVLSTAGRDVYEARSGSFYGISVA